MTTTTQDPRLLARAADWFVTLAAGATPAEQHACSAWRQADPEHERAWQRVAELSQGLRSTSPLVSQAAHQVAMTDMRQRRRIVAGLLGLGGVGVALGLHAERPWRQWQAGYRTATGEQQQWPLAGGGLLGLNTGSALDLNAAQQQVWLYAGEMLLETPPVRSERPWIVTTPHGDMATHDGRFNVRLSETPSATWVQVMRGELLLHPRHASTSLLLRAGEQTSFNAEHVQPTVPAQAGDPGWLAGVIEARDLPLATLLAELGRYRQGWLRCDPAVAGLRITGTFPVRDTDQVLASLPHLLPVRITRRSDYWVMVGPAQQRT